MNRISNETHKCVKVRKLASIPETQVKFELDNIIRTRRIKFKNARREQ